MNQLLKRAWDALDSFKQAYPENWTEEDEALLNDLMQTESKFKPLTTDEVTEAWNESEGAKNRLKAFYAGMDDKLYKKNKLRQYKENT